MPSSITKSEPTPEARDPAIFCLTNSGTASGTRNFFACRKALAGCRGAALTWWSLYYRPCGGNTNMYLVPIFSPERWQSVGSSAPLSPPQERTVSRRRRETTKCASALNARMIFGTAATTATQKFRRPDSKSFCRFRDAAVPRNRQTGSTENSRSAHLYKLHFVSFVVRSATLKKPRNGGNFRDRMCNCNTVTRDAITIATWSGLRPDTLLV